MDVGKKAPDFTLTDRNGEQYSLKSFKERFVVLYFYPKDDTPGCTVESKEFSDALKKFAKLDAAVVGISGGTDRTKAKFCEKHELKLLLLSDPDFSLAQAYGAYGEKTFMGRKYNGIMRETFILDESRKIVKKFENVKPAGHAEEVLAAVQELQ